MKLLLALVLSLPTAAPPQPAPPEARVTADGGIRTHGALWPARTSLRLAAPRRAPFNHSGTSAVGESMRLSGSATWCAPTPTRCQGWGNGALLGAVRSFRYGDHRYRVRVSSGGRSVIVTIVSFCACGSTLIDLSPAAFSRLAPLSRGRIPVRVERLGSIPLPATDTE